MHLTPHIYLVGSGGLDAGISNAGDCHVYLLDGGAEYALVDAGGGKEPERILANVRRWGLDPSRIRKLLLTHCHGDHAAGCAALKDLLPGLQVWTSAAEGRMLAEGTAYELGYGKEAGERPAGFPRCTVGRALADGEEFTVGGLQVRAIEVPGHNYGCVCFLAVVDGLRALFAGDVVSHGGVISIGNWPGSDSKTYQQNLNKLSGLNIDALLPGHRLFTLGGGQRHIDRAIEAFAGQWPPRNINTIPWFE
jgi:hydroxyacylglutathione hydrolase